MVDGALTSNLGYQVMTLSVIHYSTTVISNLSVSDICIYML